MKAKYLGDETGQPCTVFGQTFPAGEFVEVEGDQADLAVKKLPGNPVFEVQYDPLDRDRSGEKGGSLPKPAEPAQPVEIPDDWRELHHMKRKALAARIAGTEVTGTDEIANVIEAEQARRAAEV